MTAPPADILANPRLAQWIGVAADGRLRLSIGKVELGQGAVTAIAAIAAAELRLALDDLVVVAGDTARAPDEGMTAGSMSIEQGGAAARWAAAAAREIFAKAAAARFGCAVADLRIDEGRFSAPQRNESLGYGDLAGEVDLDCDLRDREAPAMGARMAQTGIARLDLTAKLAGGAFIQDMDLPGLLHGRVLRAPRQNMRLARIDRAAIEALPGVRHVAVDGDFIGLVAGREDEAERAAAAARRHIEWRGEETPALDDENAWMDSVAAVSVTTLVDEGVGAGAAQRIEAVYSRPWIAHASIGPSTAIAEWRDGALTVWTHSQGVYPLRAALARALEAAPDKIRVVHAMGAGCYGHNGADDVALDAALLARAAGAPVRCQWSRADELAWSPFGAPMRMKLSAALDSQGRIVEWTHEVSSPPHVARPGFGEGVNLLAAAQIERAKPPSPPVDFPGPAGAGDRNAIPLYAVGRRRIVHRLLPQWPVRTSALRSLGAHGNIFAIESFMDELAARAGVDPIEFRLAHLTDARARAVVRAAGRLAGWDARDKGGAGEGRGIGFARYKNSGGYCAVVARVEATDKIAVTHAYAAVDCGAVVHADGLRNQIEGGIVQAASWTLKEAARFAPDGPVAQSWADYPILNFSECPEIHVEFLEPDGAPSLGGGECAAGPTAAAIANALAHALGLRVRNMPLTPDRIRKTIETQ
ncbi:MAG: xanthine dehydrogenase family protein molybdopterin-binding subunit [Hyphomicrobiales bacterium]|nr:xanthine dehydrogenase family protein molybdopterin-binding subunit [Hyphomicrobiales bacterium]